MLTKLGTASNATGSGLSGLLDCALAKGGDNGGVGPQGVPLPPAEEQTGECAQVRLDPLVAHPRVHEAGEQHEVHVRVVALLDVRDEGAGEGDDRLRVVMGTDERG